MAVKNSYYETIEELGAAYAVYIIQGHVFMDGNKRAGSSAMFTFLELNGVKPSKAVQRKQVMIDLQFRAENGENTGSLINWLVDLI